MKTDNLRVWLVFMLSFIGVVSLCLTLFFKSYADPSVLTALIAITGTLIGKLTERSVPQPHSPSSPAEPAATETTTESHA